MNIVIVRHGRCVACGETVKGLDHTCQPSPSPADSPLIREMLEGDDSKCRWVLAFDDHYNISCPSRQRANGNFKPLDGHYANWDFKFCPYCGREIAAMDGRE